MVGCSIPDTWEAPAPPAAASTWCSAGGAYEATSGRSRPMSRGRGGGRRPEVLSRCANLPAVSAPLKTPSPETDSKTSSRSSTRSSTHRCRHAFTSTHRPGQALGRDGHRQVWLRSAALLNTPASYVLDASSGARPFQTGRWPRRRRRRPRAAERTPVDTGSRRASRTQRLTACAARCCRVLRQAICAAWYACMGRSGPARFLALHACGCARARRDELAR